MPHVSLIGLYMKFKTLIYASVTTCFLSFSSLLLCVFLSPINTKTKEWLVASFFCFIASIISARVLRQGRDYIREETQTNIGNSNFEVMMVTMILWAPVTLAIFSIVGIMFMNLSFEKFGWVLVVLAGNTGFQVARLPFFSPKN